MMSASFFERDVFSPAVVLLHCTEAILPTDYSRQEQCKWMNIAGVKVEAMVQAALHIYPRPNARPAFASGQSTHKDLTLLHAQMLRDQEDLVPLFPITGCQ